MLQRNTSAIRSIFVFRIGDFGSGLAHDGQGVNAEAFKSLSLTQGQKGGPGPELAAHYCIDQATVYV